MVPEAPAAERVPSLAAKRVSPHTIRHTTATHLLRAGWFDKAAGIVLGSWHECGPPEEVLDVLVDRLVPLGVPMVADFGFGHCPGQLTVPRSRRWSHSRPASSRISRRMPATTS